MCVCILMGAYFLFNSFYSNSRKYTWLSFLKSQNDEEDDEEPEQVCINALCVACHKVAMSECWK